jgi:ubiquinone/menaquinone biosynthesis C-methylase UbiE
MKEKLIFNHLHHRTKRNYEERSTSEKPQFTKLAKEFGFDYWDNRRETGYGGYIDDGRWAKVADIFIQEYSLTNSSSVLDVGCGKGFLLKELKIKLPGIKISGVDISKYALENSSAEIKEMLSQSSSTDLPFEDKSFDLVLSINVLHNLGVRDLLASLREIVRVGKKDFFICVESFRDEEEKWNLMRWQLTCEAFHRPDDWKQLFELAQYRGDYEFIFFT